jgi:subtilisin family serine protease
MYCVFRLIAWAVFCLMIFSPAANTFWDNEQQNSPQTSEPSALVIKYMPGVQSNHGYDKSGIVLTNNVELNSMNQKYAVRHQQRALSRTATCSDDNPLRGVFLLYPEEKTDLAAMAREFESLGCVEYAHPNYILELYDQPDDFLFEHQWALNNTGQGYYHVLRRSGYYNDTLIIYNGTPDADIDGLETLENPPDNTQTVIIAIIDTGVDWEHPDLLSRMWFNPGEIFGNEIDDDHNGYIDDIYGWNFSESEYTKEDNFPLDTYGHGTHCAGIVAAVSNNGIGVAGTTLDARIMAIKFDLTVINACRAIIYAADNGADVINMSWGQCWPALVVEQALEYARSRGVILVAAGGNNGDARLSYPAGFPATIAVSASNSDDHITTFSNYNDEIDVCAPGQSVLSLRAAGTDMYEDYLEPNVHIIDEYYYLSSGTSMSAPHVVGVAGYMRAVSPGLTPDMTQAIIEATADDIIDPYGIGGSLPGWDKYSGHGRVNLPAALAATPNTRAQISAPQAFSVVSGSVAIIGSADGADFTEYALEYGSGSMPSEWIEIANSSTPVSEALLGTLLRDGLQGLYTVRLLVNESNMAQTQIFISDQPVADIQFPIEGQIIGGEVTLNGSALCGDFSHTVVEYGIGTDPSSWTEIEVRTTPVYAAELATWNTIALDTGAYTLRISVYSNTDLEASDTVNVTIGSVFAPPNGWMINTGRLLAPIANYADVNQDGFNEILMGTNAGMLIIDIDGTILTSGVPYFPTDDYRIPPAVGRLDNDSMDDVVAVGASGILYGFPSQGDPFQIALAEVPDNMDYFIPADENRLPKVFLKDIDGDGIDEIHYFPGAYSSNRSAYHFIYRADGSEWGYNLPPSNIYTRCFPADLDGDGVDEIYCYGNQLAEFDTCGYWLRSVDVEWEGIPINDYQLEMSAVDMDGDNKVELIVHGYFNVSPVEAFNYQVFAYDEGLQLKSGWPHDLGINARLLAPGHPVFGDLDNDGTLEYIMAHLDVDYGYLHAWHIDGEPVLGDNDDGFFAISPNPACFSAPLILDCNSDGFADIVVASGSGLTGEMMIERILAFDLNTELIEGYPFVVASEYLLADMHMPVYNDINGNGFLDVVYPSDHGKIGFASFPQYSYDPERSFCPMWRYNRQLNSTQLISFEALCGDANNDRIVNVSDAVFIINYVFMGGDPPYPFASGDVNCDGTCNVSDAVWIINYVFVGGNYPCDTDGNGEPDC